MAKSPSKSPSKVVFFPLTKTGEDDEIPYKGQEILSKRKEAREKLVKWSSCVEKDSENKEKYQTGRHHNDISLWMTDQEISYSCPQLLIDDTTTNIHVTTSSNNEKNDDALLNKDDGEMEEEEREDCDLMVGDVTDLISRAHHFNTKFKSKPHPHNEQLLSNTVSILSAYAKISSLADTFKQSDVIDLLLDLLSSAVSSVRTSASVMLKSLAVYDATCRSYILLTLSSSLGRESDENKKMLLDLFLETSQDEEKEDIEETLIPHVPLNIIHSLLKTYLKLTSKSQSSTDLCNKFEYFAILFDLINQLFIIFKWVNFQQDHTHKGTSIFLNANQTNDISYTRDFKYMSYDDFPTPTAYSNYVESVIEFGMKVRAREQMDSIHEGEIGVYKGKKTNIYPTSGIIIWDSESEESYVPLKYLEIVTEVNENKITGGNIHQFNTLQSNNGDNVNQSYWWELLSLIRNLPSSTIDTIILSCIDDPNIKSFQDLLSYIPSYEQVYNILTHINSTLPHINTTSLTVQYDTRYVPFTKTTPTPPSPLPETSFPLDPPYPEPFGVEDPRFDSSIMETLEKSIVSVSNDDFNHGPVAYFITAMERSRNTSGRFKKFKDLVESHLKKKKNKSCKFAVHTLRLLHENIKKITTPTDRVESTLSGLLSLILKLMKVEIKSPLLQSLGIVCFYSLLGGHALHEVIPVHYGEVRPPLHSTGIQVSLMAALMSVASSNDDSLKVLKDAIECVVKCYHLKASDEDKQLYTNAIRSGLSIIVVLLNGGDTPKSIYKWSLLDLINLIKKKFPDFPVRAKLFSIILSSLPGALDVTSDEINNDEKGQKVIQLINHLVNYKGRGCKNPLPRLLEVIDVGGVASEVCPCSNVELFLCHNGIMCLSNAVMRSNVSEFTVNAVKLLLLIIKKGEKEATSVVLQGGLEMMSHLLSDNPVKEVSSICMECLDQLCKYYDLTVVTATHSLTSKIKKLKDNRNLSNETDKLCSKIIDIISCGDLLVTANRNSTILRIIFKGILERFLDEIDQCRRARSHPLLPYLSSFMRFISNDSNTSSTANSTTAGNQCWDKLEVSSSEYNKSHMLDNNQSTYWEGYDRRGDHWIKLSMIKNTIIKKLCIGVNPSDGSSMPSQVLVQGGASMENMTDLKTVNIPSSHQGLVTLLTDCGRHYPLVLIKILKCQQDTTYNVKIRSLKVEGRHFSRWTLFGELFTQKAQLFYHIQTCTWMNQFASSNPLQLFEKLSSAVNYEQSFADCYLSTTVSRQSLGVACRTALFNPLVTSIKNKDTWGQLLIKLLNDYCDQVCPSPSSPYQELLQLYTLTELPQRSVEQVISSSQTRRMCKLLIDVNDTNGDTNRLSIIDALSKIWKDIVSKEVTNCLLKIDFTTPPLLIMGEFLYMYDKLCQSTSELFGAHSCLVLSLKEGFSTALQCLNDMTALKFCEVISLCFNHLLDTNTTNTSKDWLSFGESFRESVLLHLAELLQFLHNLDVSSLFEHFYRKHLSGRLLSNRSISVAMETRLIQALDQCFPNKQPQHMITDWNESQNSIKRFRQSYLLNNLDSVLACNHGNEEATHGLKAKELTERFLSYQHKVELHVLVLTSHYWPVNYRPLPLPLPLPLMNFIDDYTQFYTSGTLQSHEKLRSLSWTLYGHATLSYNTSILLHVTTPQMIILLQFNDANELSYHDISDKTELPIEELNDSLLSLTSERHHFLLVGGAKSSGNNFNNLTTFSINKSFIDNLWSKESVHRHVYFHDDDSKLMTNFNDKSVELFNLFERRRTIIDTAIVKMLKKEKKMTIDDVVIKVIKGCAAGQFEEEGGVRFACFDSNYKDVCSRIERLIIKKYIERLTTSPQILVYVPDPYSKNDNVKVKPRPSHTQPDSTPSINPSKVIHEEEECPLTDLSLGTMTQSVTDVEREIETEISELSSVLLISSDIMESILYQSNWNEDIVLQRFFEDRKSLFIDCGLSEGPLTTTPPSFPDTCPVCLSSITIDSAHWLWCEHVCCKSCWQTYTYNQVISLSRALSFSCIVSGCNAKPTRSFIHEIMKGAESHIKEVESPMKGAESDVCIEFSKSVVRSYVGTSGCMTWCRNPQGCDRVLSRSDGHLTVTCGSCQWSSCLLCNYIEAHQPLSCDQIQKWIELGGYYEGMGEDARSQNLANIISKRCPGCNAQIEKNEGCLHLKCKCGHHFCWRCMKPWQPTHTDYFNCSDKVSKTAHDAKKFVDYNQQCANLHKSVTFSMTLYSMIKTFTDPIPIMILSFLTDSCQLLKKSLKVLMYLCVAEYFNESGSYYNSLSDILETNTMALQAYLENILMTSHDVIYSVRCLTDHRIHEGQQLVYKVESLIDKILYGSTQQMKLEGVLPVSVKKRPTKGVLGNNPRNFSHNAQQEEVGGGGAYYRSGMSDDEDDDYYLDSSGDDYFDDDYYDDDNYSF